MKGILMFDSMNDLVFFKADDSLLTHLHSLAVREGFVEDTDVICEQPLVEKNIILHLFAPILASYKVVQSELGDSYHSIEMENGVSLMFQQILTYIAIGVRSTKEYKLLEWEVSVFLTYVKMLYGPSLYLMKEPLTRHSGLTRLQLLSLIIDKCHQVKTELQMYLIEAVERLILKPDVTATCVDVLQEALHKIRSSHNEGIFSHSFLLVDYKLLALYSSRNSGDLPKDQLLLLIIIAKVLNTKLANTNENCCSEHQLCDSTSEADVSEETKLNSLLVFLKTPHGDVVPHIVYIMNVTYRVTLVTLCEMAGKGTIANHLSSLIKMFHHLQIYPTHDAQLPSYQSIATVIKNLIESGRKLQVPEDKEKYLKNIQMKWELAKQNGIQDFLRSASQNPPEPRLESTISAFSEACKMAFGEIITCPELAWEGQCLSPEHKQIFSAVLKMASKRLKSSLNYIESETNSDNFFSSHMADFPGLVHFIYVDRSNDCIIALSPIPDDNAADLPCMKKKIWNMVEFGRKYVDGGKGFFCLWHMDKMHFFYSIWFEDSNGKRITPTVTPNLEDLPEKGILCGNFFKLLVQKCFPNASHEHIYCYEMFCAYLETTSASEVVRQSRRLSARLWEFSGAYKTPLDLL